MGCALWAEHLVGLVLRRGLGGWIQLTSLYRSRSKIRNLNLVSVYEVRMIEPLKREVHLVDMDIDLFFKSFLVILFQDRSHSNVV